MRNVTVSDLKARFAKFLRIVKTGEIIQIQKRGIPIALIIPITNKKSFIIPPKKNPKRLSKMKFTAKLKNNIDVVNFLVEDRKRR